MLYTCTELLHSPFRQCRRLLVAWQWQVVVGDAVLEPVWLSQALTDPLCNLSCMRNSRSRSSISSGFHIQKTVSPRCWMYPISASQALVAAIVSPLTCTVTAFPSKAKRARAALSASLSFAALCTLCCRMPGMLIG
jgi:hypothetical protein